MMNLKRFTILMYLQKFFAEFSPIYPLYALMFSEYGGLSVEQISWLFFIWFAAALLAEIPTGIVADKISRRYSSLIGRILLIGTFVGWLLVPTFWGYAFGFVLWGIGFAFTSGATDSYLFDTLKKLGGGQSFTRLYARTSGIKMFGMFSGFTLGTLLIPFGYQTILLTSIGISLIVPIILLLMPHDDLSHMHHRSQRSILTEAVSVLRDRRLLLVLAAFLMFIGGIFGFIEEFIALYYSWNGFSTQTVAAIMTIGLLLAVAIESTAHYFDTLNQRWLFVLVSLAGFGLFTSSYFYGWIAIVGLYIFIRTIRLIQTSLTARMHTYIETDARSTVFSLVTFVAEAIAIMGAATIATLQATHPEVMSIALVGLLVGVVSLVFVFLPSQHPTAH